MVLNRNKTKLKKRKDTLVNTIKFQQRRIDLYEEALLGGKDASKVFTDTDFEEAPETIKEAIQEKDTIWKPNSQVQIDFLSSTEKEVLFAGGRGSGKSSALIVDALRYCPNPNFRGLVIRRTMPELRELIGRAKDIYFKAYPGTKWKEQDKLFIFPSGAKIEFGYCDNEDDLLRYQGQQYQWIGVDELTQFKQESMVEKLLSSLRSTDPTLPNHFRATTNPSGPGLGWVKRRFVDKADSGKRITETFSVEINGETKQFSLTRKWFHSTIFDNTTLVDSNPEYIAQLASLEDNLKKQWLYGQWDSVDGLAFNDFVNQRKKIVVEPFSIPQSWERIRGADWGYSSPAVCLWLAFDPEGTVYVYRELAVNDKKDHNKCDAAEFATRVLAAQEKEYVRYGVLDGSAWARRGESAPSAADTMIYQGCPWIPADRSPHSRVQQKLLIHSYLKCTEDTQPKLKIFNTCKSLINCLATLELDKHNNEDINTDMDDHAYDALRYALASKPHPFTPTNPFGSFISNSPMAPINSVFGY